jgi:hypothetical protein
LTPTPAATSGQCRTWTPGEVVIWRQIQSGFGGVAFRSNDANGHSSFGQYLVSEVPRDRGFPEVVLILYSAYLGFAGLAWRTNRVNGQGGCGNSEPVGSNDNVAAAEAPLAIAQLDSAHMNLLALTG